MSEPAVALVADQETLTTVETHYALLCRACRTELAELPVEMTFALSELVTLIEEGLQITAAAQTPNITN